MKNKICSRCNTSKPISEYYNHKNGKYGVVACCIECCKNIANDYHRTKDGLITKIYSAQKRYSRHRNHPVPSYTMVELRDWMFSQRCFHELFDNWKQSNYKKDLTPSCDRLDDYKPYTLDNLRVVTWMENNIRAREDKKNGINTKDCEAIFQIDFNNNIIEEHYSASQASRTTGINRGNISSVCLGKRKTAGGYKWRYANETN